MQHFLLNVANTGNNATLLLPAAVAEALLENGDELGVFAPDGALCGAAVFENKNLALAIWGDDPSTPGVVECLATGQQFSLKVWRAAANAEQAADFALQHNAPPAFETNGIYTLEKLSLLVDAPEALAPDAFRYFPNPTTGRLHLQFQLNAAARLRIELLSADGKNLSTLLDETCAAGRHERTHELSNYPDGAYFIKVSTASGARLHPLVLEKK